MTDGAQAEHGADAAAVARCRAGDPSAFAEIVERHQVAVFGTALRLTGDREAALEIANAAFYKAYRALEQVDVTRPLRPWLVKIASNAALDWLRERGRDAALQGEAATAALARQVAADPEPEDSALQGERRAAVRRALLALPAPYRVVAVLRYLHDYSYAEISEHTGWPVNTIGVYLLRARGYLRRQLSREGVTADDLSG
jgi:RNA polymerase sigma-70 factor (ECF subfamily)